MSESQSPYQSRPLAKKTAQFNYWEEAVFCSMDTHGVTATKEQIDLIAADMENSHENYGQAFYSPSNSDHYSPIIRELERKLDREQRKTVCPDCKAYGSITTNAGPGVCRSSTSRCWKCNGDGFLFPT